jgi:hypothetical protein
MNVYDQQVMGVCADLYAKDHLNSREQKEALAVVSSYRSAPAWAATSPSPIDSGRYSCAGLAKGSTQRRSSPQGYRWRMEWLGLAATRSCAIASRQRFGSCWMRLV